MESRWHALLRSPYAAPHGEPVSQRSVSALRVPDGAWLDMHSFRRAACADMSDPQADSTQHQACGQVGHSFVKMFHRYASKARAARTETAGKLADRRRPCSAGVTWACPWPPSRAPRPTRPRSP